MVQAKAAERLRIVQVISNIPDAGPVPWNKGGTEKMVYELTESLVRRGYEVYLFAARGSRSKAKLITYPRELKSSGIASFVLSKIPKDIDIIHDHTFHSEIGRQPPRIKGIPKVVCTIHMPYRQKVEHPIYVSQRARTIMGGGRGDVVYNGIDLSAYEFSRMKNNYLLFLGRIIKSKGILQAMDIADRTKKKLIIAGPVKDRQLFERQIRPRMKQNPNILYVGSVDGAYKQKLLKHAQCVLFPAIWEEPFGLVMVEAMACGTPVLALRRGSVPEVLSGFPQLICRTVAEMERKVNISSFPKPDVLRNYVARRFTNARMTNQYLSIYRRVLGQGKRPAQKPANP